MFLSAEKLADRSAGRRPRRDRGGKKSFLGAPLALERVLNTRQRQPLLTFQATQGGGSELVGQSRITELPGLPRQVE